MQDLKVGKKSLEILTVQAGFARIRRKQGLKNVSNSEGTSVDFEVYRFAGFEADFRSFELRKHGLKVKLQEQPLRILQALVERRGELVTREELRQRLWPQDLYVDFERNLTSAMNKLRVALSDSAGDPRYIETLPRRGYRFFAQVEILNARTEHRSSLSSLSANFRSAGSSPEILSSPPENSPTASLTLPEDETNRVSQAHTAPGTKGRSGKAALLGRWAIAAVAVGIGVMGLFLILREFSRPNAGTPRAAGPMRIAVLPFANLTGDPHNEYLCDGMTEEMITVLCGLSPGKLDVIARTSSMTFKNTSQTAAEIGDILKVNYLLECSVRDATHRLHINVQLIRTSDDVHVWANEYDREMSDVLKVQAEVARSIAEEIQIRLPSSKGSRLAATHSINPKAYEAYAMGRFFWNKRNDADTQTAISYFKRALEEDPTYAAAYAGLADSYTIQLPSLPGYPLGLTYQQAKNNALKALELDDTLAEAHTSLAFLEFLAGNDRAAEKVFRRAIELDPSYANSHHWYAIFLQTQSGRTQEAILEFKKALDADPLSVPIHCNAACEYINTGQFNKAQELLDEALKLDPKSVFAHGSLGSLYSKTNNHMKSATEFREAAKLGGETSRWAVAEASEIALAGDRRQAEKKLTQIFQLSKRDHVPVPPYGVALTYAVLGQRKRAFYWLNRSLETHEITIAEVNKEAGFDALRPDPRWTALQINFAK